MDKAFSAFRGLYRGEGSGASSSSSSPSLQNYQVALPTDNYSGKNFQHFALMSTTETVKPELADIHDEEMEYVEDQDEDENSDEEYQDENYDEDEYDYDFDVEAFSVSKEYDMLSKFEDLPAGVEVEVPWLPTTESDSKPVAMEVEDEIDKQYKSLKQFDTVEDYSDHHYAKNTMAKPSKDWSKRIQREWQVLENDLPESIYVRVYEDRMDLLRAAIEGPLGTPYHDGLFFFDVHFPPQYPSTPPLVHYHSGGLRLNPNLYGCGKVCLSLLGTWHGNGCEVWNASRSTMLQVLLSIQALILNENPYYNEPGYEKTAHTVAGQKQSLQYNENTFALSCKTMLYSLRKPPMHFDILVSGHFRKHGKAILTACEAYMEGATVGCDIEKWRQAKKEAKKKAKEENKDENKEKNKEAIKVLNKESNRTLMFKNTLQQLFDNLLMEFVVKGADCNKILERKRKRGERKEATSTNHVKSQEELSFSLTHEFSPDFFP